MSIGVGGTGGLGGWTDRSFTSSTDYREVRHSILGGFAADVRVQWRAADMFEPFARIAFGGGAFTIDQPLFGPTAGFSAGTDAVKQARHGHVDLGIGLRITGPLAPGLRLGVSFGFLLVAPLVEVFTFTDNTTSRQEWSIYYDLGVGGSASLDLEFDLSPAISLQLRVNLDAVHTRWNRLVRMAGSVNYAPTTPETFSGEVSYDTGSYADESPTADGFSIRRHAQADGGVAGFIGAWGVLIAVVIRFG
ncbi:MAG: hypothetical protein AB7S36_00440 [Planctomycetota bacterium]